MFMVNMMYRMKKRKDNVSCCPLGCMHDGIVECEWYGLVTLKDCAECIVRKDKSVVLKGDV